MARLTNSMRDSVVRKVLKFKFEEREKVQKVLADKAFNDFIDACLGEHKAAFDSLPNEWKHTLSCVQIKEPGGEWIRLYSADVRLVPGHFDRYIRMDDGDLPDAARKVLKAWLAARRDFTDEKDQLQHDIKALLFSVTTTKKLYEVWPELAQIVPQPEETTSSGTALTISVTELNKSIGLPIPEVA